MKKHPKHRAEPSTTTGRVESAARFLPDTQAALEEAFPGRRRA